MPWRHYLFSEFSVDTCSRLFFQAFPRYDDSPPLSLDRTLFSIVLSFAYIADDLLPLFFYVHRRVERSLFVVSGRLASLRSHEFFFDTEASFLPLCRPSCLRGSPFELRSLSLLPLTSTVCLPLSVSPLGIDSQQACPLRALNPPSCFTLLLPAPPTSFPLNSLLNGATGVFLLYVGDPRHSCRHLLFPRYPLLV